MNEMKTNQQPVIPPVLLLLIALGGLLVALFVWVTQPSFGVIGVGALGVSGLSLLMWALLVPEQLMALLRGRALSFGGTALLVTVVLVIVLALVYILIRNQNLRVDFSERNQFTLTEEVRDLVEIIAADPTTPDLRIVGFYGGTLAAQRGQIEVLLREFEAVSEGRVDYEFIDPDLQPALAERYAAQAGSVFLVPLVDGAPDIEQAEPIAAADQRLIAEALIRVSALGDFRAYFLVIDETTTIENAEGTGLATLATGFRDIFGWQVEEITISELTNPELGPELGAAEDGEVIVIPGGRDPLPDQAVAALRDYVADGGDLVIFSAPNLEGGDSLATGPQMTALLEETFGVSVNSDLVIDLGGLVGGQSVADLLVENFSDQFIVSGLQGQASVQMQLAQSLNIADDLPESVTVTPLARTSDQAYAKEGLNYSTEIEMAALEQAEGDRTGELVVGLVAENTALGARLVLWGNDVLPQNVWRQFDGFGIRNFEVARRSIFWAGEYDTFLANLPTISFEALPQDTPLLADAQQLGVVQFVTLLVMPFGVLALGAFVWWLRRERRPAV